MGGRGGGRRGGRRREPESDAEAGFRFVAHEHFDQGEGGGVAGGDESGGRESDDADDQGDGHGLRGDGMEVGGWGDAVEVRDGASKDAGPGLLGGGAWRGGGVYSVGDAAVEAAGRAESRGHGAGV